MKTDEIKSTNRIHLLAYFVRRVPIPWWFLVAFLGICLFGFVYEFSANYLGLNDMINLFGDAEAFYFDPMIVCFNILYGVVAYPISLLLNTNFSPLFVPGGRDLFIMRRLSDAAILTLQLGVLSIIIGFVIALFLAVVLVRPGRVFGLKYFAQGYVDFFRSTPLLVQLFLFYFGLPTLIQGLNLGVVGIAPFTINFDRFILNGMQAALIGLSLNTGAYQGEILRGGILAIPIGQTEAARALGMTSRQTIRHVILPQALRIIIPPFTNESINLILNTSLAYAVTVPEITRVARNLSAFYWIPFELYFTAALFYFIMCFSLAKLTRNFERKYRIPGLGVQHD